MDVGRSRRAVVGALVGVLAGGLLTVAVAGPAAAKGPQHVTITPPGGDPVEISSALPPDESDSSDGEPGPLFGEESDAEPIESDGRFARLTEDLGIWVVTGSPAALLPERPTENLGPALMVEWTMYNPRPDDPDAAPGVVQTLYPLAEGGPLVHTEGGQRYFQRSETAEGWFRAPDDLLATLGAAGVEVEFRTPDVADGGADDASAAAGAPAGDDRPWAVPVGLATGIGLAATLAVVRARRRGAGGPRTSARSEDPATTPTAPEATSAATPPPVRPAATNPAG